MKKLSTDSDITGINTFLFERMPLGAVYQDSNGIIIAANLAAQKILGLSFEQMQGRTSLDPRWRAIHEDGSDFPGAEHPAMQVFKTGEEVRDVIMGVFNPKTDAYTWINITSTPVINQPETRPEFVVSTFEDITSRKQAEDNLQMSEQRLKLFVFYAPAAIAMFDSNMRYIAASRRFLSDYRLTDQDIIGRSHYEIFPEISDRWKKSTNAALREQLKGKKKIHSPVRMEQSIG